MAEVRFLKAWVLVFARVFVTSFLLVTCFAPGARHRLLRRPF